MRGSHHKSLKILFEGMLFIQPLDTLRYKVSLKVYGLLHLFKYSFQASNSCNRMQKVPREGEINDKTEKGFLCQVLHKLPLQPFSHWYTWYILSPAALWPSYILCDPLLLILPDAVSIAMIIPKYFTW